MDDYSVPVLVDAKTEYTNQLINILKPHIFEGIRSIYKDSVDICIENNEEHKVLMTFQNLLSNVPKWSQEIIDNEYERIINESQCDWLEDLITAVFVSHTKILTAIRIGRKHKKINLKVPKSDHMIHKIYLQVAREFWKTPFLLDEKISTTEYQRNMKQSEELIINCINETIRQQLPVKHILKEYLGTDYDEDIDEIHDFNDNISKGSEINLKKMIKKELKTNDLNIVKLDPDMKNDDKNFSDNIEITNGEIKINKEIDEKDNSEEMDNENSILKSSDTPTVKVEFETINSENNDLKDQITSENNDSQDNISENVINLENISTLKINENQDNINLLDGDKGNNDKNLEIKVQEISSKEISESEGKKIENNNTNEVISKISEIETKYNQSELDKNSTNNIPKLTNLLNNENTENKEINKIIDFKEINEDSMNNQGIKEFNIMDLDSIPVMDSSVNFFEDDENNVNKNVDKDLDVISLGDDVGKEVLNEFDKYSKQDDNKEIKSINRSDEYNFF